MVVRDRNERLNGDALAEHRVAHGSWLGLAASLVGRGLVRPALVVDLLALVWAFRRRDWYRRTPFLPLPDPEYMRWRMYTAYGDESAVPPPEDVIRFARWRRDILSL